MKLQDGELAALRAGGAISAKCMTAFGCFQGITVLRKTPPPENSEALVLQVRTVASFLSGSKGKAGEKQRDSRVLMSYLNESTTW